MWNTNSTIFRINVFLKFICMNDIMKLSFYFLFQHLFVVRPTQPMNLLCVLLNCFSSGITKTMNVALRSIFRTLTSKTVVSRTILRTLTSTFHQMQRWHMGSDRTSFTTEAHFVFVVDSLKIFCSFLYMS